VQIFFLSIILILQILARFFTYVCTCTYAHCYACNYTYRPLIVRLWFVPSTNKRSHSRSPRYIRSVVFLESFMLKANWIYSHLQKIIHNYTNLSLNLRSVWSYPFFISLSFFGIFFSLRFFTKNLKTYNLNYTLCRAYIIVFDWIKRGAKHVKVLMLLH